jgi:hypothetical protein
MAIPVGGTQVNLYVSRPFGPTDTYTGIEEIGTCIMIVEACLQNLQGLARFG